VSDKSVAIAARLEAWRARGADRAQPLRFHRIEALARHARSRDGEARRLLEARLHELVEDFAAALQARAAPVAASAEPASAQSASAAGTLAAGAPTKGG